MPKEKKTRNLQMDYRKINYTTIFKKRQKNKKQKREDEGEEKADEPKQLMK